MTTFIGELESITFTGDLTAGATQAFYLEGYGGPGRAGKVFLSHIVFNDNNTGAPLVGAVVMSDLTGERQRGTITIGSLPNDGDTVTINDAHAVKSLFRDTSGALRTSNARVFEFDSNGAVAGTNRAVAIGATTAECAANLAEAIRQEAALAKILVEVSIAGNVIHVVHLPGGVHGGTFLAESTAGVRITVNAALTVGAQGNVLLKMDGRELEVSTQRWYREGLRFDILKGTTSKFEITCFYAFSSVGARGTAQGAAGVAR